MTGQAMTVIPGETACIRCVFETPPDEDEIQSCREAGIVGPVAGAIGEMQAGEAMRALRAQKPLLSGKILTYDASGPSRVRITAVSPRPGCGCGASKQRAARIARAGQVIGIEETMSYITNLKCRECGQEYPISPLHVCETCFGPLEVTYDYARIRAAISRSIIEKRPHNLWRYRELLPVDFDGEPESSAPTPASPRCCIASGSARNSASSISI